MEHCPYVGISFQIPGEPKSPREQIGRGQRDGKQTLGKALTAKLVNLNNFLYPLSLLSPSIWVVYLIPVSSN